MSSMTTTLASIEGHDCGYATIELPAHEVSESFYALKRGGLKVSMRIAQFTRMNRTYPMVMATDLDHLHWMIYEAEMAGRRMSANWARLSLPTGVSPRSKAYAMALNRLGLGDSFEALKDFQPRPPALVFDPSRIVSPSNFEETMTFEKLQSMADSVKKPPSAPWHHGDW